MQHHVPGVGMQEEAPPGGQAGNGKQGMPVAPHLNAGVTSNAETEEILQPSSMQDDVLTKKITFHQLTAPDKVSPVDTISKPEQENEEDESDYPISLGSVGHPHSCAQPCKYFKKPRGCKDGDKCANCHCCVWRSYRRNRAKKISPS